MVFIIINSLLHIYIDIDECVAAPCDNGGTCTDQVNSYTCNCVGGYTGLTCQTGNYDNHTCILSMSKHNF